MPIAFTLRISNPILPDQLVWTPVRLPVRMLPLAPIDFARIKRHRFDSRPPHMATGVSNNVGAVKHF